MSSFEVIERFRYTPTNRFAPYYTDGCRSFAVVELDDTGSLLRTLYASGSLRDAKRYLREEVEE